MTTIFDLRDTSSHYKYIINGDITLHIERIGYGVAFLYLSNDINSNVMINIPNELSMYTFNENGRRIKHILTNNKMFTLCWTENYVVEYNNEIIINLTHKRGWDITTC